ncbi:uncharacterized protein DMAD_12467 [Drosophila madeirensis]|uniref:Uncharacterized protein n=1 Tax=Drosophila madeirensis TaxID=30013 RepID=A0AAU9FGV7_DROMD
MLFNQEKRFVGYLEQGLSSSLMEHGALLGRSALKTPGRQDAKTWCPHVVAIAPQPSPAQPVPSAYANVL